MKKVWASATIVVVQSFLAAAWVGCAGESAHDDREISLELSGCSKAAAACPSCKPKPCPDKDAGQDAAVDAGDSGSDAGSDADADSGTDTGTDSGTDGGGGGGGACVQLVNHAPTLDGTTNGSVQMNLGENVILNSTAVVTNNLFVPGTPTVMINGTPNFGGIVDGTGSVLPNDYSVLINNGATLGQLVRRTDPDAIPAVAPPPAPPGNRSVVISMAGQDPGDFATLRDLTLNSNVGQVVVPPGTYGDFIANSGSGFTLGDPNSSNPTAYNFQNLTLDSGSTFTLVGPVIITLANGISTNASMGSPANPDWLTLLVASGGLTLNSGVDFYGDVRAPSGQVTINAASLLQGCIASDRLTVSSNGTLTSVPTSNVVPFLKLNIILDTPLGKLRVQL